MSEPWATRGGAALPITVAPAALAPPATAGGAARAIDTAAPGEQVATGSPRGTLVTIGIGELLVQLGLSPVTAVVPGLAAALGVSAADGAWILTVFILALAGTLLVSGRLGDLLGHRRVFGVGALVTAVATALAGLAPSFEVLLAARAAQGVGVAMVSGNNLAILSRAVPAAHVGKAIAVVLMASSLSGIIGSALATVAVAAGAWPLVFLGLAPLALVAAVRARGLPDSGARTTAARIDWAGAALLVLTITALALVLNHPHTTTSEVSMPVFHAWLPLVVLLGAGAFLAVERRVRVPILDWSQLRHRAFAAAVGVNAILHLTMMAALFLGPLLVVRGMGLDTVAGGMLMVMVQTSNVAMTLLGGWLYDRTRAPWLRPLACGIIAVGLVAWAVAGWQESYVGLLACGLFAGLGSGILLSVNSTVIMGCLPAHSRGVASGMLETTRHFGHAFGVTIPTAIVAYFAVTSGDEGGSAIRAGFVVACLAMAGVAALGAALALIRPAEPSRA